MLNAILSKVQNFLEKEKSFDQFYRLPQYNDEPKLFQYFIRIKDRNYEEFGGATSLDEEIAKIKAISEAIERYSLDAHNYGYPMFTAKISNLKFKNFLNPLKIKYFTDKQRNKFKIELTENTKFRWIKGNNLLTGRKILVPSQMVFVPFPHLNNEPLIILPISTGAAFFMSKNEAIEKGILEIIERDAFMIHYLNKINSPRIKKETIRNKKILKLLSLFERYLLEVHILYLQTDIDITSICAILIDRTKIGPAVSVGLKSSLDPQEAILGALEESFHSRSWIRDNMAKKKKNLDLNEMLDRGLFWSKSMMIGKLNFWLKSKNELSMTQLPHHQNFLKQLTKILESCRINQIYWVDLTPSTLKNKIWVVKVIMPQLQPIFLNEDYPYFGSQRLSNVPSKINPKTRKVKNFNKIPHPFL